MGDSENGLAPPGVKDYAREITAQQEAEELRRASGTSGAGEAGSSSGGGNASAPGARQAGDDGTALVPPHVQDIASAAGQPRDAGGSGVGGGAGLTTGHFDLNTSRLATNQMGLPAAMPRMYPPLQANMAPPLYPFTHAEYELEGNSIRAQRGAVT